MKDYGETSFITGLRAVAAILVVLLHAGGGGLRDLGASGVAFVEMAGRGGVYMFFVISGFSVSASYLAEPAYGAYLWRRFWRIAPLYYVWIGVVAAGLVPPAGWAEVFRMPVDAYNVLLHLSFLSFLDYRIANSIVGVEWSLPIEMVFYLIAPFVLVRVRSWSGIALLIATSFTLYRIGLSNLSFLPVPRDHAGIAFIWSPLPYVFCFGLGIAAFRIRERLAAPGWMADLALSASVLAVVACANIPNVTVGALRTEFLLYSVITFLLICVGSGRSHLMAALLNNGPVQFIGLVSYSLYLNHSGVLWLMGEAGLLPGEAAWRFAVALAASILLSAVTYAAIEQPGQRLGRRLGARLFLRRAQGA